MIRLNFPLHFLPAVQSGKKRCTVRVWPKSWHNRFKPGQRVHLAFGRRDRPVLVPAVIEAVERYDLAESVTAWANTAEGEEVELEIPDGLLEAIRASSVEELSEEEVLDAVDDLLDELAERGRTVALAIWFRPIDSR